MTFVCNAGPVIALAKIDRLSLLRGLSHQVMIPETVFHEVLAKPGPESSRILKATCDFIAVRPPSEKPDPVVQLAARYLDAGENAVISLASSVSPPVTAILDDAAGRKVASQLGIPVLGLIGLLLIAKQQQLVTAVVPLIEQVRNQGYWLSDELLYIAKSLAHE